MTTISHRQSFCATITKVTMKSLFFILTVLFSIADLQGQTSLSLFSKKKKYEIKTGEECYIQTVPTSNDTAKNYYNVHIGYVISFKDSILTLTATGLNTVYNTKGGIKKLDRVGLDNVTVSLHIKQIEGLENFRSWFMVPAAVGWLALISTVVVSPLVSTSFKPKSFDTTRFIKVGGISLGTAAIFMTIAYGFGRHSSFINNGQKKHKRLWTIQE